MSAQSNGRGPGATIPPASKGIVLPQAGAADTAVVPARLLTPQVGAPGIEDAVEGAADGGVLARRPSLAELVETSGLRRVHMLAWRDLDDPESGGSELHADKVAERWARAGIDVSLRTAMAPGHPESVERHGYTVVRKAGRYSVFPRTALSGALGRTGPWDGLVEIWNGMPFFSPVWARCPRVVFLHHVHAEMWRMVLSPRLAKVGETVEFKVAPPMYRRTRILTLSQSSRHEIIELLGLPPRNISVVPPGIDPAYVPSGERSPHPLVLAVGRLVPVKRFGVLIDALLRAHDEHPTMEAVIVGEGYERAELEKKIRAAGAGEWLRLVGRVDDGELLALYQRAWVLTSASAREGWGMTITEAAACGTPSVATRIAGHTDAVVDGETGLLVEDPADLGKTLAGVLTDNDLRARLAAGALAHAATFTWAETARATFAALVREAARRRGPGQEAAARAVGATGRRR